MIWLMLLVLVVWMFGSCFVVIVVCFAIAFCCFGFCAGVCGLLFVALHLFWMVCYTVVSFVDLPVVVYFGVGLLVVVCFVAFEWVWLLLFCRSLLVGFDFRFRVWLLVCLGWWFVFWLRLCCLLWFIGVLWLGLICCGLGILVMLTLRFDLGLLTVVFCMH